MKHKGALALVLFGCVSAAAAGLYAQAQNSGEGGKQQQQPQKNSQQPPPPQATPNGNPFPGDVNSVPVMPSGNGVDYGDIATDASSPDAAPPRDTDPVRSPEELRPSDNGATEGFSSSRSGTDNIVPPPDNEPAGTKGKKGDADSMVPHETAEKDVEVGNYYLDNKNWRGALSRFQSAMVLAPDNPDIYWGLAECYRRLGQFADARANYQKVVDYDPDSKHGKDAKKALKEPDLANAGAPAVHK